MSWVNAEVDVRAVCAVAVGGSIAILIGLFALRTAVSADHDDKKPEFVSCVPGIKKINGSMEDVQHIRVAIEEQTKLLREIRDSLKKRK